jgi:hypothetical protein
MNGGPFYRIVAVRDACELHYSWYEHNPWIKLPEREDVPTIG